MFGQGSPNFQRHPCTPARRTQSRVVGYRCAPRRFRFPFALMLAVLCLVLSSASQSWAQQSHTLSPLGAEVKGDLRLRFAWGGGIPQAWRGKITVEAGELSVNRTLAITSDAPSTVIARNGEVFINHRIATSYGGADLAIRVDGNTKVRLQLQSEKGETFEQQWTLQQLEAGINESVDQEQNRISISRTPGDDVRIDINRAHLIFEPGETWRFDTQLQRTTLRSRDVGMQLSWGSSISPGSPLPNQNSKITTDETGTTSAQSFEVVIPETEGVHELWIEAEAHAQKSAFGQFRRPKKLRRRIQIVVVSPEAPLTEPLATWKTAQAFTPQQLRGGFRAPWPIPRLPGSQEPIRKGDLAVVTLDESNQKALEFAPDSAVAIPVRRPENLSRNQPVKVSLQYRPIPGTKLAVHYLSSTQQVLHGMDSGISVPDSVLPTNADDKGWMSHEFHLWPEDEAGYLYIANPDSQTRALVGELKIEVGPPRLSNPTSDLQDPAVSSRMRQRMAMLESPDFAGLFQAARSIDSQSGQALDDWNTFYDSIDRLTQHLKDNLYDGAFVTVASDGSSIFPLGELSNGPRFDSGIFSSSGCDPVQKDVVELILRMFDREGLKLVPVLTLNTTLPQLETMRNSEPMSFDLVDFDGRSIDFTQRLLPIYNPLDRNLQGVCQTGIAQLAARYQQHTSFGGVGLTCRPDCCTLLPGARHGFDDITVQRFLQAGKIDAASFERSSLLASDGENPTRDAWLAWRSAQMFAWYRDMAKAVRGTSDRSLYLLPVDIDKRGEVVSAMSPSLHRSGNFAKVIQQLGLDLPADAEKDGVVMLAPKQIANGYSLAQRRIDLNIDQSRIAQQFFAEKAGGSLFTHRGRWKQLDSEISIPGMSHVTRKQLLTTTGNELRKRYINAIRKYDCRLFVDGGQSLPRGELQSLDSIFRILGELPAQRFKDVGEANSGPVCMRQYSENGQHWFYAVNDSPWPVEVSALLGNPNRPPQVLQAATSKGASTAPLTTLTGDEITLDQIDGRTQMRIYLEPWSMYAGTSRTVSGFNPLSISSFSTSMPDEVNSQLRKQLYQLKNKLAKAKVGKPINELQNGGFESFVDPDESGWEFGNHEQASFDLDSDSFHEGATSLSMQTTGKPVWIRSNVVTLPDTGRLSISVWLKTADPANQPPLRISVDGVSDGSSHYRFGAIGSLSSDPEANPVDSTWRRFAVHFDDLPEDLTNIRIGFDLMGQGQVSIDQVELFDRWFDENDSEAMTQLLAGASSQLSNPESLDNARRILESYWVKFLDEHIGVETRGSATPVEKAKPFEIPLPSFDVPSLSPTKPKRVPLFQRFQRRE